MKRFMLILLTVVALFAVTASSAMTQPTLEWTRTYNSAGNLNDFGRDVAVDTIGNIYATGFEDRADLGQHFNIWVRKYDTAGNTIWTRTYNSPANNDDRGNGIAVDAAGNPHVTGWERRTDLGLGNRFWLRQYDTDGNTVWTQAASDVSEGKGIVVDGGGSAFVIGEVSGDIWVGKYDATGNLLWSDIYASTSGLGRVDVGLAVALDSSVNAYFAGYEASAPLQVFANLWLRKYDTDGNAIWTQLFNLTGRQEIGRAVVVDADANIYIAGSTYGTNDDILTLKYAPLVHVYDLYRFDLSTVGFVQADSEVVWPTVLNPTVLTRLHLGPDNAVEHLFAINGSTNSYYFYNTDFGEAFTVTPETLAPVAGHGNLSDLWTDGINRLPDFVLGWDPDGDGNDELWAILGSNYYVFDWVSEQFGPVQPFSGIGYGGTGFNRVIKYDSGGGRETLVAFDGTSIFLYNPTNLPSGGIFLVNDFTSDGSSFALEFALSVDFNLDGEDDLFLFDLETDTVWKWNPVSGQLESSGLFSTLWPGGEVPLAPANGDFLFSYHAVAGATPPEVYGIQHH